MDDEQLDNLRKEILNDNKMLYCMHKRPMDETCMCWGLEVPSTWLHEIDELSRKLEGMNSIIYPIHRVRIQADQVKDKYGTLRFYYTVIPDPPAWMRAYERAVEWVMSKIKKLDFKLVAVTDKEAYDKTIEVDVPAEKVAEEKARYANCSNVDIIEKPDGTAVKKTVLHYYKQIHYEPTKHKMLYSWLKKQWRAKSFLRDVFKWKPSHSQECICKVMDSYTANAIKAAENNCMHICEHCGHHIGDEWSPVCMTMGWVSYLCEECAMKERAIYMKDGKKFYSGKAVEDNKLEDIANENTK